MQNNSKTPGARSNTNLAGAKLALSLVLKKLQGTKPNSVSRPVFHRSKYVPGWMDGWMGKPF